MTYTRLGIIADDLTGAVDTGVQFARHGLETLVLLEMGSNPIGEVLVVTTDSRDEPPAEAYHRAAVAATSMGGRFVYKKIDSTVRGNVGAELDGLMDALSIPRALVAPAFPATGRTTVNGIHMVHGVPLAEGPFARDPIWPAKESHLPTMLARQTKRQVGHIPLSTVERGTQAVAEALRAEPAAIVVADVTDSCHLAVLAAALVATNEQWLPCGSAGLAEEIPGALGLSRPTEPLRWTHDFRPTLIVAGSRHQATAAQLRYAAAEGAMEMVELAPEEENSNARERIDRALAAGRCVALVTTFSGYKQGRGKAAAEWLAREAARVVRGNAVCGAFLTGGDVARAFCRELGATALRALGEVQPGVAIAALAGGDRDGFRVVTKAGGFGNELAVLQSIACLRGS